MSPPSAHLRQPAQRRSRQPATEQPNGRDERRPRGAARRTRLRGRAAVAASILALAAAGPAVALAAEPDGTAPLGQPGDPDSATDPDFDPGGEETHLPTVPAPAAPAPGDSNSDDPDPTDVGNVPIVDPGDNDDLTAPTPPAPAPTAPPTGTAPPTASPSPAPAPAQPAPTATPQPAPSATPVAAVSVPVAHGLRGRRTLIVKRARVTRVVPETVRTAAPSRALHATSTPGPTVTPARPATAARYTASAARPARSTGRVHVVRAGESLWSIAGDLLGPDASPARVAREVDRLWQRNRERIATGDPDLLRVGTTLRLR